MGLFATLTSQASAKTSSSSSSSSSSLDLPTVVQLYRTSPVKLLQLGDSSMPSYAVLTYSAVPVTAPLALTSSNLDGAVAGGENQPDTPLGSNSLRGIKNKQQQQLLLQQQVPELGVWNCRILSAKRETSDAVLLKIPCKPKLLETFCFSVDLSHPLLLAQVEPTLTLLQEALVRYLIARPVESTKRFATKDPAAAAEKIAVDDTSTEKNDTSTTTTTANTTSLYALRSVQFGLAPKDEKSAKAGEATLPEAKDRSVMVCIVICAKLPSSASSSKLASAEQPPPESYWDKQAQALVVYHLRRYAAALNANLCFVAADDSTTMQTATSFQDNEPSAKAGAAATAAEEDQQPTASKQQLAYMFRELALGRPLDLDAPELKTRIVAVESSHSLVYGPSNQQHDDLIETVLLRNAQYPGQWDASEQSLWTILPANNDSNDKGNKENKDKAESGDQFWLEELWRSTPSAPPSSTPTRTPPRSKSADTTTVSTPIKTPATTTTAAAAGAASSEKSATPDVSDFFAKLLNSDKK